MSDSVTVYTAEHTLMEEKVAHAATKDQLDKTLERNLSILMKITAIKKSYWYRIGKFLHLVP